MLVDYHSHTRLCKHAEGDSADYVAAAIARGLDEFGLCDHSPMPGGFDPESRMEPEQFEPEFLPMVRAAQDRFGDQIALKFGIEADFEPGTETWLADFLARHPFDYVIGSVHFLGSWGFDHPGFVHRFDERPLVDIYADYYDAIARSARSGLFDIIGHADLVKKFGHRLPDDQRDLHRDLVNEAMRAVKSADMTVEINTAGLRKPVGEIYPSELVLTLCRDLGIPLTLGSDAHRPSEVATDFDRAVALVERFGGGQIATFTARERTMAPVG